MDRGAAIERLELAASVRADASAGLEAVHGALRCVHELRSMLAACEADLTRRVVEASSFPEATLAELARSSTSAASRSIERATTLEALPSIADALGRGAVTPGHVDAITRAGAGLDPDVRRRFHQRADELVALAEASTVGRFRRRLELEADALVADDGTERLERQRRATRLTTWTDADGMWNLRGRFDPVTALSVSAALDHGVEALFAQRTPTTCPADPRERQHHLRALALAALVGGGAVGPAARRRAEFVAVIDVSAPPVGDAAAGPDDGRSAPARVTWPLPIEVPQSVLAQLVADADQTAVVVRDGVVLHAPGTLDLGRSTRLANRAQRRALRALHDGCVVPGCDVGFDRCAIHHVRWWRHGGTTELSNLAPICARHHVDVHERGWVLRIDRRRRVTVALPDGSVRSGDPPPRRGAA